MISILRMERAVRQSLTVRHVTHQSITDPFWSKRLFNPSIFRHSDGVYRRRLTKNREGENRRWRDVSAADAAQSRRIFPLEIDAVVSDASTKAIFRRSRRQRDLGRELTRRRHFRQKISMRRWTAADAGSSVISLVYILRHVTGRLSDVGYDELKRG